MSPLQHHLHNNPTLEGRRPRPMLTSARSSQMLPSSSCSRFVSTLVVWSLLLCRADAILTSTTTPSWESFFPTSGPLDDATCNIEDLEKANDSQLHIILQELITTSFFRHFIVDLDQRCPLDDDDTFECSGGGSGDDDPDEEPAEQSCTVKASDNPNPFLPSNALSSLSKTLSQTGGFQSKAQQDTFAWKKQTDIVVRNVDVPCEAEILPDSFWIDICSSIKAGDGTKPVDLALNPEHNTAYNGAHIWKAIYEENCILAPENSVAAPLNDGQASCAMCFEERVLYRLLSGLHTSTTLSIAKKYYPPSKRKNRPDWEPNPDYFMEKFLHNPEHLRNLHFSYVVLLRALQKATPLLYHYEILTGDIVDDETATILLRRLLDSAILNSCSSVFSAFDESLMFREKTGEKNSASSAITVVSLQKNFKGVFHNISSILDCVQCQQCKLHGKMVMLGYGAALKILFMRNENPELTRNEMVAFINTIAKFSESLREVRELTHLFWENQQAKITSLEKAVVGSASSGAATAAGGGIASVQDHVTGSVDLVDAAVRSVAELGSNGHMGWEREAELVQLALQRNPDLLILAKHYGTNSKKFLELIKSIGGAVAGGTDGYSLPDAIVVGSGLAGLAAALNILDRGGSVVIIEKEHSLGGNSKRASSGINACCPQENSTDTQQAFMNDTIESAGSSARPDLIETLVSRSGDAVAWLKDRVGVDLSLTSQLGGHSSKRTHRPSNGMVGAEIIYGMQKAVKAYEKSGRLRVLVDTKVSKLVTNDADGSVVGVEMMSSSGEGPTEELRASNVILATGGFASDRSSGSYLEHYRPELLKMPTTAGEFSTGDGITLATSLGAGTVDMDKVQVHPTGWVNPQDPDNTNKILAAELMRGVGGLLVNSKGKRFCDELGTRAYVTKKMLSHDAQFAKTGKWDINATIPTFSLVLSSSAAADGKKHVDLYTHKGLMTRLDGVSELAKWMGLHKSDVVATLKAYQNSATEGSDEFGKTTFRGLPAADLEKEVFYAGTVTPVLHYCMGGITIDKEGNVLNENGEHIRGLHAAGEVTGGVHGVNRLAGNSLLECTVYGTIVGQKIPIKNVSGDKTTNAVDPDSSAKTLSMRKVQLSELQEHATPDDCWVAIHGVVYDLTEFAEEHPAGSESIYELAGKDGTAAFAAVHNEKIMEDFGDERIGVMA